MTASWQRACAWMLPMNSICQDGPRAVSASLRGRSPLAVRGLQHFGAAKARSGASSTGARWTLKRWERAVARTRSVVAAASPEDSRSGRLSNVYLRSCREWSGGNAGTFAPPLGPFDSACASLRLSLKAGLARCDWSCGHSRGPSMLRFAVLNHLDCTRRCTLHP